VVSAAQLRDGHCTTRPRPRTLVMAIGERERNALSQLER
jgi:hypothetical protein